MAWWLVALLLAVAAGHTVRLRARYSAAPAKVWDTITNMLVAPNWRSKVRQVERLPDRDGKQMWVEVSRRWRLPLEFEVVEPGRQLVTRVVGEELPFGGSWTYEIVPDGSGTLLTVTEDGELRSQTLRFFARYAFGYHATVARYLRDLGKKLGEKVKPERLG